MVMERGWSKNVLCSRVWTTHSRGGVQSTNGGMDRSTLLCEKMKRTILLVIAAVVVAAVVVFSCNGGGNPLQSDGTLTFDIAGVGIYDGIHFGGGVIPTGLPPAPKNFVADNGGSWNYIAGGAATIAFKEVGDPATNWIGTGGASYDVYVIIDMDGSGDPSTGDRVTTPYPLTVTIDGNTTISKTAADFTAVLP
ncbi:MAG TPA: hypothetical protein VMX75_10145 [Spirochaetia bacterium]|nr:hypothetical protein [Spirochaetia bacterium]